MMANVSFETWCICGCVGVCCALLFKFLSGTSLVIQKSRPHVPSAWSGNMVWEQCMVWFWSLIKELDPTCCNYNPEQPHTHTHTHKRPQVLKKCPPDPSSWINSSLALMPNITSFFEDLLSPNLEIISPAAALSLHWALYPLVLITCIDSWV